MAKDKQQPGEFDNQLPEDANNSLKGKGEDIPTWGKELQNQLTQIMQKLSEGKGNLSNSEPPTAQPVPVPPPPKPKEKSEEEVETVPTEKTEIKKQNKTFLDFLF